MHFYALFRFFGCFWQCERTCSIPEDVPIDLGVIATSRLRRTNVTEKKGGLPLPIPFLRLKVILIGFSSQRFELSQCALILALMRHRAPIERRAMRHGRTSNPLRQYIQI